MKVDLKKAIDITQAVGTGAAAAMGGAFGLAGASAFSTLLSSFSANDSKQAAMKPADFLSTKKPDAPSITTLNTKADAIKDSSKKYEKAASKADNKTSNNNANTAAPQTGNNESNEPNENDADTDNTAKADTKNAAPQTAKEPQTTQKPDQTQQPVKMEDVIKALNLNEQQVQQLTQALNLSVSDLKQMQITVQTDAQTGAPQLTGLMAGGKEQTLSAMLGMNATDGKAAPAQAVMDKIAGILNLDKSQKQDFFAQLNVSSISSNDVKTANGSNGVTGLKNSNAAQQADQTQPVSKNAPSVVDLGKIAVQDAAQSGTGGNSGGGNSFNGEAGAQIGIVAQKNDAAAEQTQKTDFASALSKAGETAIASATQGKKIDQTHAITQTQMAEAAKPDAKVMSQIVEKASILQLPNSTQTIINLNPKELGNVEIKLTMRDSSVTASIVVENQAVKQVVEQNMAQLKDTLHQQGISVDNMMVSVNQQNKDNSQNSNHSQREAAGNTPFTGNTLRAAEPAADNAPFSRRPIGNHRISLTA